MTRSLYAQLLRRFDRTADALTRRELLRVTAAAAAATLLSRHLPLAAAQATKPVGKRIVVIGAGFAGLAAAYELKAAGYDVTVIDAQDRVGGRVLSFTNFVPGRVVEGGGELIGSNHPTWVAYAEKFGLQFLDVTEDENLSAPVILDGKRLSDEDIEKLFEEVDAAYQLMNDDAHKVDADRPWQTPNAEALDRRSLADWIKDQKLSEIGKRAVWAQLTADNGAAPEKQSYLGMITQVKGGGIESYWSESEVYRCKGGNQQLAFKLAEAIGKERLVLGLPVTEVRQSRETVRITCKDGRTLECDDVILATAPTVWNKIQFEPAVPAKLMPQMGSNIKYLAALKSRFWKAKSLAPDSLSDGMVSMTWEGTDNQEGDENPVMVGFSGGPPSDQCLALASDKRDEAFKAELEKRYPGFSEAFTQARFMGWPKDPWTMASYSFPAPGQVTTVGPLLDKGIGKLHFAGEHTNYKFVGYMEGALNSGVTVARRLAARDGVKAG